MNGSHKSCLRLIRMKAFWSESSNPCLNVSETITAFNCLWWPIFDKKLPCKCQPNLLANLAFTFSIYIMPEKCFIDLLCQFFLKAFLAIGNFPHHILMLRVTWNFPHHILMLCVTWKVTDPIFFFHMEFTTIWGAS